ncbi:phage minor tail protein L [Thorsellia anophelis]|uniref:Lambda-like phage minor tail protein L n=1 Tax=Thorsellia anophelis DSM 18579 TaxID=1123402 RepID=A0A1I0D7A8_9GAMM|nr:phage minor tail protein L [Thorsellia anophelis]SET27760.1 lambda-like phage minor tail protein L [Thorsellia anophelis DSM 18579]
MISAQEQLLQPDARIKLIEVDGEAFGADIMRFHYERITYTQDELELARQSGKELPVKSIWWQGNEYMPFPYQIEGIEASTDGQSAEPKLSIMNVDQLITALCLRFDDMLNAKVTIHETFKCFLDERNFPEGNPQSDPSQERIHIFYINQKSAENDEIVEFTLGSPFDLQGVSLPNRQIHAQCHWANCGKYRSGDGCNYLGTKYFDRKGNVTDDPSKDSCGGLLSDCKARFGEDAKLPFGGFPASSLIRR